LRFAVLGLPDTLFPLDTRSESGQILSALLFSGLTRSGMNGDPEPDVAKSWDVRDGGATWVFHLRPDATWHDGAALTASDVLYTVDEVRKSWLADLWQGISDEQVDANTVMFHVPVARAGDFLPLTTLPLLPQHFLGTGAEGRERFATVPVGSGPFRLERITALGATLKRTTPTVAGGANVDTVQVLFASGPGAVLPLVKSGAADIGVLTPTASMERAATDAGVVVAQPARAAVTVVLCNTQHGPLADSRVRQALSLAIDRSALVAQALGGLGLPTAYPLPSVPGAAGGAPARDSQSAGALLDAAGWTMGADHHRHRGNGGNQALGFTLLTSNDPERLAVAQRLAEQWNQVGAVVTVEQVGAEGLFRDFLAPGRFDAAIVGTAWALPDRMPGQWWRSPQGTPGPDNFSRLADMTLESELAAAEGASDPADRARHLQNFTDRFLTAYPAIPLYQPTWLLAMSPRTSGVHWSWEAAPGDLVRGVVTWRVTPP
jgi:peptide/nickel transport system substrate-binding protein